MPWRHRLHYLQTTSSYLVASLQVAFLLAPVLYLLFGVAVVRPGSDAEYLRATLPFLLATAAFLAVHAGWKGALRTVQSSLFAAPVYVLAVVLTLAGRKPNPNPTAKARQRRVSAMLLPQVLALVGSCVGIAAVLADRGHPSEVAVFWAGWVALLLAGPLTALTEREAVALRFRRLARAAVVVVALLGLLAVRDTPVVDDRRVVLAAPERGFLLPPVTGAYMGVGTTDLQVNPAAVREWTERFGHRPQIVQWFQQWRSGVTGFRADWLARAARGGSVPMITWEPWARPGESYADPDQSSARLSLVVDGAYDRYIRSWAEGAAAYGGPMLLRFMHEMNGYWYPWSIGVNGNTAELYVAAWRHVHDLFTDAGADNVSWVWSPNQFMGDQTGLVLSAYPGDEYVDWVAMSGFNWGDHGASRWTELDEIVGPTYDALAPLGRPMMLAETSTVAEGGDPAAWMAEGLRRLEVDRPQVRAVVWYDARYDAELDLRLLGATADGLRAALAATDHWDAPPAVVPDRP
jgi:mannan endo-1,4-beta-mannosidase